MAIILLSKLVAAILDARCHRVQNDQKVLKAPGFDYNILRARHCAPKTGEPAAFSVSMVNDKKKKNEKFTKILLDQDNQNGWHFAIFWSTVMRRMYVIAKIRPFEPSVVILHPVTLGNQRWPPHC